MCQEDHLVVLSLLSEAAGRLRLSGGRSDHLTWHEPAKKIPSSAVGRVRQSPAVARSSRAEHSPDTRPVRPLARDHALLRRSRRVKLFLVKAARDGGEAADHQGGATARCAPVVSRAPRRRGRLSKLFRGQAAQGNQSRVAAAGRTAPHQQDGEEVGHEWRSRR